MNDHDPTNAGPAAPTDGAGDKVERRQLQLETFPPEERARSLEQMLLATGDIFGVLAAKLVGLGIIQAPSLRLDLLGQAKIAHQEGNLIRAGMIQTVADNLQLVIDEIEHGRNEDPHPAGHA